MSTNVVVKQSTEVVDLEAFAEAYARIILAEVEAERTQGRAA